MGPLASAPPDTCVGRLAFAGHKLPDATLRGKRRFRSHGGTVPTVAGWDLSSEVSSLGSVASCRKQFAKRGADTPATFITFASAPLPRGRLRLLAGRWPRVTGLTSYLSGCVYFCSGVTRFHAAPIEEVDELCRARSLPAVTSPLRTSTAFNRLRPLGEGGPRRKCDCVLVCAVATITLWVTASARRSKLSTGLTRLERGF
jgi:hypothetical protein